MKQLPLSTRTALLVLCAATLAGGTARYATESDWALVDSTSAGQPSAGADGDIESLELDDLIDQKLRDARERWGDAKLTHFSSANVYPEGYADLTLGENGAVTLRFASNTRSRAPDEPRGVAGDGGVPCLLYVVDERTSFSDLEEDGNCAVQNWNRLPKRPHCGTARVWKRAIDRGVAPEDTVARLDYRSSGLSSGEGLTRAEGVWIFTVGEEVGLKIADTCHLETPAVPTVDLETFDPWSFGRDGASLVVRNFPDAEVTVDRIDARSVESDGTVKLTESDGAQVEYHYVGRDRSGTCRRWEVIGRGGGVYVGAPKESDACAGERAPAPPDCTFEEVRRRARSERPDLELSGAAVEYRARPARSDEGSTMSDAFGDPTEEGEFETDESDTGVSETDETEQTDDESTDREIPRVDAEWDEETSDDSEKEEPNGSKSDAPDFAEDGSWQIDPSGEGSLELPDDCES